MAHKLKEYILAKPNVIRFDHLISIIIHLSKQYAGEKQQLRQEINKLKRQVKVQDRGLEYENQMSFLKEGIKDYNNKQSALYHLSSILKTFQAMPDNTFTVEELFEAEPMALYQSFNLLSKIY